MLKWFSFFAFTHRVIGYLVSSMFFSDFFVIKINKTS